jgi:hypothetical protein
MEDGVSKNKANLIRLTNVYLAFNLEGAPSILNIAAQSRNPTPLTTYPRTRKHVIRNRDEEAQV